MKEHLNLQCEVIPGKNGTWTAKIEAIWSRGKHQNEVFVDEGYLTKEDAEKFLLIKATKIKELMESKL